MSLHFILHVIVQVSYAIKIRDDIKTGLKKKRGAKPIHMTNDSASDGRL